MKIKGTNITMVRGDNEQINVTIKKADGTVQDLVTGDTIYFTVKKKIGDTALIAKTITVFTNGVAEIPIVPLDTKTMSYITYFYDIQVKFLSGVIKTIIPKSEFTLTEEVTE